MREPVDIKKFVPDPSMSSLTTEDMEKVDVEIDHLLQDADEYFRTAKPITPQSVNSVVSIMSEGDDLDAGNSDETDEPSESGAPDDDSPS